MIDLQTLVEETGAESGLSFNIDGVLNESVNLEYDGNVASNDRNDFKDVP